MEKAERQESAKHTKDWAVTGENTQPACTQVKYTALLLTQSLFGGFFTWMHVTFGAEDPGQEDSFGRPVPCYRPHSVRRSTYDLRSSDQPAQGTSHQFQIGPPVCPICTAKRSPGGQRSKVAFQVPVGAWENTAGASCGPQRSTWRFQALNNSP
ncbi:uncharacterized protein LOC100988373 isoform X2 [Pan paniscus]|uniref:uncharacterized protein LOC100988373 isoform X2 n=1 Tax=Pan paniscus TaxID=9597 RepID=UPI0006C950FC|nr:uncharacterized protein LOC100988373 isoform X3 [Pan paniscus]